MRIGIDVSQIVYQGSGVATYTENLVEHLLRIDKNNTYILFGSSLRRKTLLDAKLAKYKKFPKVEIKTFCLPPLILEVLWNQLHLIPVDWLIGKVDAFHSSDWLQPPSQAKKITTIHDLAIFRYPTTFSQKGGHDIVANQKRRLGLVKKEVDLILVDSESTKKDIASFLYFESKKIKVVPLASEPIFKPQSSKAVEQIKRKYKIKGQYLLSVGTVEPRKNLKGVISALNILISRYPDMQLMVVGKTGWGDKISKDQRPTTNIRFLGFIPKENLPALYAGAECFVYPSYYEGFGLPVLEAMSCGCPVVVSKISSLPEVVGQAGVLIDPEKPKEIARGIMMVLKSHTDFVKKGIVQAKKFSWTKTAEKTLEAYREVVKC